VDLAAEVSKIRFIAAEQSSKVAYCFNPAPLLACSPDYSATGHVAENGEVIMGGLRAGGLI
jgi:hypothetical protein